MPAIKSDGEWSLEASGDTELAGKSEAPANVIPEI